MKMNKKWLLILVLVVAAFLRLWRLSDIPVSLFGDELDVGYHAFNILKTGRDYSGNFMPLHFQSLAEWRTPLYLYSVVPTVAVWGITPLGVRIPAAIFGILGVWGMYLLVNEMMSSQWIVVNGGTKSQKKEADYKYLSIIAAAVMAFSPWHIQYSRAAFEVTMLLSFFIFGLYFFFRSFRENKWFPLSLALFIITPLIYSSAKLFAPILILILVGVWWRDILSIFFYPDFQGNYLTPTFKKESKKIIFSTLAVIVLFGIPTAYATLYSGGTQRFGYISVFTDPTRETEVGVKRETAAHFRGETGIGLTPTVTDKVFYNKITFWGERIMTNYLEPFSSEFLFLKGDLNLRHSVDRVGQLYKVEAIALVLGLVFFFGQRGGKNKKLSKTKIFIALWILLGVVPSAITRNGGRHATRLILVLPPLIFLIAYGIYSFRKFKGRVPLLLSALYILLFSVNFVFYQKNYWTENPWHSERWWHSGYREAIQSVKEIEKDYDRVLITMANEPAWIFFGAYMEYDPDRWQEVLPDKNWVDDEELGRVTNIDKFYFASPPGQLYDWNLSENDLFLASEKEVGINLLLEPERTPGGLNLIKTITYPSGIPAFYLFDRK